MKSIYWRPKKISGTTTLGIGVFATLMLITLEWSPHWTAGQQMADCRAAVGLAASCRAEIRQLRSSQGLAIHQAFDPTQSGMLGAAMTPITSKPASLDSKQVSIHPQFPTVVMKMLRDAGVKRGDCVAVGWTGSFPGLNIALASCIEVMDLKPVAVASVMASQYGANEPELTWLDMETALVEAGLLQFQSRMATIGGPADTGHGMQQSSIECVKSAASRNHVPLLAAKRLKGSIRQRLRVIKQHAGEQPIAAYINVGGGIASCGGSHCVFSPGAHPPGSTVTPAPDCVMQRFAERGVPVIHLAQAAHLAKQHRLANEPESWSSTGISLGHGTVQRVLAGVAFLSICGLLWAFILRDEGNRIAHHLLARLRGQTALRPVGQREGPQLMV